MMARRLAWSLSGLLALPLSGCWDVHPLEDQGIVLAIGISHGSQKGALRWTFTFPNVTLSPSSLTSVKRREQYYDVTVHASTFGDAVMRAQQKSSRIIYLGQLQGLIWPDTLSWRKLWPIVAALNAQGPIPKTFWMMAATPPLQAVMKFVSPQVVAPRTYLATYFDCVHCQPFSLAQRGWEFWSHSLTPGVSPYVPLVNLEHGNVAIRQIVVYPSSGHPVPYSPQETEGFGFLSGKVKRAALSVHWNGHTVELTKLHDGRSVSVRKAPGGIMVNETLRVSGFIGEPPAESSPLRSQNLIRRLAQQRIVTWCLAAIRQANNTRTDPFGYAASVLWGQGKRTPFLPIHAHITVSVSLKGEGMLR